MSAAPSDSESASVPASLLHDLTLISPWFELTRDGLKKFEGRLNRNQASAIRPGDYLRVRHDTDTTQAAFHSRVLAVHAFPSFEAGLTSQAVSLADALPQVESVPAGVAIYREFYPLAQQAEFGALFIRTERVEEAATKGCTPAIRQISLWLQADEASEAYRLQSSAIHSLSSTFGQSAFAPHITLASFPLPGRSEWGVDELQRRISEAATFSLAGEFESVAIHPTAPFMVVFEMMRRTAELLALREAIFAKVIAPLRSLPSSATKECGLSPQKWPACSPFVPHLSLLYDARGELSPVARVEALTTKGDGLQGALKGMRYDLDVIRIVDIDTMDYASKWQVLGEVRLPKEQPWPAAALAVLPLTDANLPTIDRAMFQRVVDDLALTGQQSKASGGCASAALAVLDGQIIGAAVAPESSPQHAATKLLTDTDVSTLPTARRERVVLFASNQLCGPCVDVLKSAQVRADTNRPESAASLG